MSDIVLPGQPIPLPRGPVPRSGSGTYTRDAQLRASIVGIAKMDGSVGLSVLLPLVIGNLTMIVFFHGGPIIDDYDFSCTVSPSYVQLGSARIDYSTVSASGYALDKCSGWRTTPSR